MPQDKFGIEIQKGDVLAMVDTYKDYPPVLCVADRGFTAQFTKVSYMYLFGFETSINIGKHKTRHLVVINEEQTAGIINKMIQARLEYQEHYLNNQHFVLEAEEEIRAKINDLLEHSAKLKEE